MDCPLLRCRHQLLSALGSGAGIAQITARTVDFGASDAPLTTDQAAACKGCVQIPWAYAATSIPYNVSGVGYGLHLTGPILANIYLGHIKKWNDKRIKAINKGVKLPNEDIVPIYRSDGSGTSYNFTDYLSHVSKEWKNKIGKSTQPAFPTGVGAKGSSGVAAKLQHHGGRHHLRRRRLLLQERFKIAKMRNRAGKFILPTVKSLTAVSKTRQEGAEEQRHLGGRPAEEREGRLPDLHVHVGDRATEDGQGSAAEAVHQLGSDVRASSTAARCSSCKLPKVVITAAKKTTAKLHT